MDGTVHLNPRTKDLTGQVFGKLTVMRFAGRNDHKQSQWECLCECGKTTVVSAPNLKRRTRSCGCLRCPPEEVGKRHLLRKYISGAKERGLVWALSDEAFFDLTSQSCYYCGTPPTQVIRSHVYNGIDRIDSKLGYMPGNVRPCCKYCNYAKKDHSDDDFKEWSSRFISHQMEQHAPAEFLPVSKLVDVTKSLRDLGVSEFKYEGLEVKFDPHFRPSSSEQTQNEFDADGLLTIQRDPKREAQRIKREQQENQDDLFWSV